MSNLRVDASDVVEASRELAEEIDRFHRFAERRARRAVDAERSGHRFQNRTGDAERSMRVRAQATADGLAMTVEMGVEYASYLTREDWTRFDDRVDQAMSDIAVQAATIARRRR
jgi:hypothetical protein